MTCRVREDLLQRHFDGDGSPGDLERHLDTCPACAAERAAITRFVNGLSRLRPPTVPPDLTDRVTAHVLAEAMPRPFLRWRRVATATLAAAAVLAVAVGAWALRPTPSTPAPAAIAELPAPLRGSVAEAQSAVVALTSRTATETVESTSRLLPNVSLDPSEPTAPAVDPLLEATSGVGAAVAPVADSARRAVGLFLRDLPMARASGDKNPG